MTATTLTARTCRSIVREAMRHHIPGSVQYADGQRYLRRLSAGDERAIDEVSASREMGECVLCGRAVK